MFKFRNFFIFLGLSLLVIKLVSAELTFPNAPEVSAKSYLLIDTANNKVLAEKNPDAKVEPASITKIMTLYVINKEIKYGRLKTDEMVPISKNAWKTPGSRMFLEVGSKVPVSEIMHGIATSSGNDAAVAIAEYISGTEEGFTELMNFYAKQLGMENTNFKNATGLPSPEHYTCAKDLAKLAQASINEFPDTYNLYSEKSYTYQGIKQFNRNRLLWQNNLCDGLKTGHTDSAGYCLVASAKKNYMRLISIVMGANSDEDRTKESNSLINWGFKFFDTKKIYDKSRILQTAKIWMGKNKQINLGIDNDLFVTLPQGQHDKVKIKTTIQEPLTAPIKLNQQIGTLTLELDNNVVLTRPLVALEAIEPASTFKYYADYLYLTVSSWFT